MIVVNFFVIERFHTVFHNGIYFKELNDNINYWIFMETLRNSLINTKSEEEQNLRESKKVIINLRELLVCFVSLTLGLFLSIIVFVLEILIFLKTHEFRDSETKSIIKRGRKILK
jgi:hypothetical protein